MSYSNSMLAKVLGKELEKVKQYQPKYPLSISESFGPYEPILDSIESLNQDFVLLLLTEPGEWPMNPDLGIGMKKYLFESYNSSSIQSVRAKIQSQLTKYLPRIDLLAADFVSNDQLRDENTAILKIRYAILGIAEVISSIQIGTNGYLNIVNDSIKVGGESLQSLSGLSSKEKTI